MTTLLLDRLKLKLAAGKEISVKSFAAENSVQYREVKVASAFVSGALDSKHGICVTFVLLLSSTARDNT